MKPQRYFGIGLLVIAVAAAVGLDTLGRDHDERRYRVDFGRGTTLTPAGERTIERIAAAMARQDAYRAIVVGHTGTRGNAEANQELGLNRAEAVATALSDAGVAAERVETHSVGGEEPLERREGEGDRGYRDRLRRAEVVLQP